MTAIAGVLFDVDDTLVDTRGAFRHALAGIAVDYLGDVDHEELLRVWREDANGWYRAHTRGSLTHAQQRHRRANDLHLLFGGPQLNDRDYARWDAAFERYFREGWAPHPDAAAAVDALLDAGVAVGALSNAAHDYQVDKLAACGLSRVPMLVGVDTLGFGKPDPRVFAAGCDRLGLPAHQVAYVGDEFDIDALAAVQAGLAMGVWVERDGAHARDTQGLAGDRHPRAVEGGGSLARIGTLADLSLVIAAHPR